MTTLEFTLLIFFLAMLSGAIAGSVMLGRTIRRSKDARSHFIDGYLFVFYSLMALTCCAGIVTLLGPRVKSSALALAGVVLMNMLAQPFLLFVCYVGFRKLTLGLWGRVCYGSKEIPEADLQNYPAEKRRALSRYCVAQGIAALLLFGLLSAGCSWPLLSLICDTFTPSPAESRFMEGYWRITEGISKDAVDSILGLPEDSLEPGCADCDQPELISCLYCEDMSLATYWAVITFRGGKVQEKSHGKGCYLRPCGPSPTWRDWLPDILDRLTM